MSRPMTQEESKLLNATLFEKLGSKDPVLEKQAVDVVNEFTRFKLREIGFLRKILPPIPLTNDQIDRDVNSTIIRKIVDIEGISPGAISVGFGTRPNMFYIETDRYEVRFNRILSPKFTKDVDELRTNYIDIRQVLSDNSIKDMQAEEDGTWLRAVNTALVGPGAVCPTSGVVQYQVIDGGITRDSIADSTKVMPNTPQSLENRIALVNNITVKDVMKWDRSEVGGDLAEDIVKNGFSLQKMFGVEWCVTIKKGLVATNTIYYFADPNFMGKFFTLEDVTMHVKREAFFIEFFSYELIGMTLANTSAVARVDFR